MAWQARLQEFVCHRCGNCCRGEGHVWLTGSDLARLARHLELTVDEFVSLHTRRVGGRLALLDQPSPDHACIFYEPGSGCRVHDAKPQQCRDFPVRWHEDDSITYCRGLQALDRE